MSGINGGGMQMRQKQAYHQPNNGDVKTDQRGGGHE